MKSRLITISFGTSVNASSKKTLVSKRIDLPFRIKKIRAFFGADTEFKTRMYFYISPDASAPTTGPPTGSNLLTQLSQQVYLTSDGGVHDFQHESSIFESGMYVKVYIDNTDTFAHNIAATVTVEIAPAKEKEEKTE